MFELVQSKWFKIHSFKLKLVNNRLFLDSFWALAGNIAGKGASLIAGIFIARFLGKDVFGEYGMIKDTLIMIAIFSTMGLGYTATKYIAESNGRNAKRVYSTHIIIQLITLITSIFLALILLLFSTKIAGYLEAPQLDNILRLSSIAVVLNAICTSQVGELSGMHLYRNIAVNNLIVGIVTLIVSIVLTYYFSLYGAVIALIISLIVNCLLNLYLLNRHINKVSSVRIDRNSILDILKFSFPIALQESFFTITHWASMLLLIKVGGYGEMGLYTAANQWLVVVMFVPGALRNVALSHFSENAMDVNKNDVILKRLMLINFVCTFFPFIVVSILSAWICSWYGDSYNGLKPILCIAILISVVSSLSGILTQEMIALNQNWYLTYSKLIRDIGILVVSYLLIKFLGSAALVFIFTTLLLQIAYFFLLLYKYKNIKSTYNK